MAGKTSKSAKVTKKATAKRSLQAAILRLRRPTAMRPCRPTSRPCRAGNATSDAISTRSSCAPCPAPQGPDAIGTRPFYGVEDHPLVTLAFHCFTKYIEVLSPGTSLRPLPPGCVQARGRALPRHPRGRPARRSSVRSLGEAGQPIARRTTVSDRGGSLEHGRTRGQRPRRLFQVSHHVVDRACPARVVGPL